MGTLLAIFATSFVLAIVYEIFLRRGGVFMGVLYVPKRSNHASVYTYDGRILERKKHGESFGLLVIPGECTMESVYTGTRWTGNGCLTYNGSKIGFVATPSYYRNALSALAAKNKRVRVCAEITGTDSGGWPVIRLSLPDHEWFESALKDGDK